MEKRHEKVMCEFYRMVTGTHIDTVAEIPPAVMRVLSLYEYEELLRPLVHGELERGKSRQYIADRWGITQAQVRSIGERFGLLPRKKWAARNPATQALY